MATTVFPGSAEVNPRGFSGVRLNVILILTVWFLLVVSLGAAGAFVGRPGMPPFAIAIGTVVPLMLFFAWMRFSSSFREFALSLDLRFIVGMQAWRWGGAGFLSLYAHKVLPAVFSLQAGLGDMAIGVTAPWVMLALIRRPEFAASNTFVRWNVLGILDFVAAIIIGTVTARLATGAPGEISTAPMARLPLLLTPEFFVPLFIMLHAIALMQSKRWRQGRV
jgi:hypothetical protein